MSRKRDGETSALNSLWRHRGFDHVNDAMCTGLIERKAPGLSIRRIGPQLLEY
jgi:hypothetical protein